MDEALRDALQELVALKEMKEKLALTKPFGWTHDEWHQLSADYNRRKPCGPS